MIKYLINKLNMSFLVIFLFCGLASNLKSLNVTLIIKDTKETIIMILSLKKEDTKLKVDSSSFNNFIPKLINRFL